MPEDPWALPNLPNRLQALIDRKACLSATQSSTLKSINVGNQIVCQNTQYEVDVEPEVQIDPP